MGLASDHGGHDLKQRLAGKLRDAGFEPIDFGNLQMAPEDDYPDWVAPMARAVTRGEVDRGMAIYGTFVFGYDGDTPQTIQDSLDFAIAARLEIANFNPLTPTPGSPLYARLEKEGRLLSPKWWIDPHYRYGDPIFTPRGMSAEEFGHLCYEAKRKFYSWRSITTRVLGARTGFDWFRTGMVGLANIISRREIMRKQFRTLGA